MNKLTIVIIILNFLIIALLLFCPKVEGFEPRNPEFDDLLLTEYPKRFICSDCIDELPKHIRLGKAGGIMYTRYQPPTEANCRLVNCPVYLKNDLTPRILGHHNPYIDIREPAKLPARAKLSYPEWKRNVYCWMC